MIINSITLKNFKSYEDETTFSFAPKNDKNIILIGGKNGSGKSTLFEAIKLCLYGSTAYGYLGENYNYLLKIKDNINDNSFKNRNIESFVSMNISFNEGTSIKNYSLKRSWNYENKKINENFSVYLHDLELNDEDKLYFDKYLKSVLPPSLLNFFFFDGEELSEFFTGKSANSNLKDAILQLFNYDTFDILKTQLLVRQRLQVKSNNKIEESQKRYDDLFTNVKSLKHNIEELERSVKNNKETLSNLITEKEVIEKNFRNSGGILEDERLELKALISEKENERYRINQSLKDFCNDTLPFLLVTDLLDKTKTQINKEDSFNSYNIIKNKLSGEILKESFNNHKLNINENDSLYDTLAKTILSNMFTYDDINIKSILNLSLEDKNSITPIIENILSNKETLINSINSNFNEISEITSELKNLRNELNSTVTGDLLNDYLKSINEINNKITEVQNELARLNTTLEIKYEELKAKESNLAKAKNEYATLLQNNSVSDISHNLINYLDELLANLTKDKIELIQNEFTNIFGLIIRKENYINNIIIDEDFSSTLYINKSYTNTEILNIIKNLGFDGIIKKYGSKFMEDLFTYYNVTNNEELEKIIINNISFELITLSTKVNINDFSNGEKQIYILCLIWAIIKSSGVEIPFIIDTPYARIDASHRKSLTNTYLPNISKQVIILSTDKEIDSSLYDVIKPYLCNEYLLIYHEELRKTEIKNGYFEV